MSDVQVACEAYRRTGFNVSKAARELKIPRQTLQSQLSRAIELGLLKDEERHGPNRPTRNEVLAAEERSTRAYEEKKRKGDWRKPVLRWRKNKPLRLVALGDPHLDNPGCNFKFFKDTWMSMGPDAPGICVGDWFDNWTKSLAHLWAKSPVTPADAWLLFEDLMHENGQHLLAACSGNHDDWTRGPTDPIALLMREKGVSYRDGAIRLCLDFGGRQIFVSIRHKWRGHSMYSPAHGITRAARFGWRDHICIGGHIHQDEPRLLAHPDGFMTHACQISAFKEYDDFADTQGFMSQRISPAWHIVIDPRRADTDPDLVKIFWDVDAAEAYRKAIT